MGCIIEENELAMFPEIDNRWDDYSVIQNAILLYDGKLNVLRKIIKILTSNNCSCNFYSIIIQKDLSQIEIEEMVKVILHFPIINVEIFIKFETWMTQMRLPLFNTTSISNVIVYNSPFEKIEGKGTFLERSIQYDNFIDYNYFNPNISSFLESEFHNLYFNKKVIINQNGFLIKSLNETTALFNFEEQNLNLILRTLEDINKWNVPKKNIDVCNKCEFRNMCVDACSIIERKPDSFFRSKECNYNPYIVKWKHELGFKNLEECGISCNSAEFTINKKMLTKTIRLLYE